MKGMYSNLTAKIISALYIILITVFAFDEKVFSVSFLMHLIPTLIFLGCLITAWFKPKIGGILLVLAGIATIIMFNTYMDVVTFLLISVIPILAGFLFFFSDKKH